MKLLSGGSLNVEYRTRDIEKMSQCEIDELKLKMVLGYFNLPKNEQYIMTGCKTPTLRSKSESIAIMNLMLQYLIHCEREVTGKTYEEGLGASLREDVAFRVSMISQDDIDNNFELTPEVDSIDVQIPNDFQLMKAVLHMSMEIDLKLIASLINLQDSYTYSFKIDNDD